MSICYMQAEWARVVLRAVLSHLGCNENVLLVVPTAELSKPIRSER